MRQLRTLFPDREFIMRSQGQVRFLKITTRFQAVTATIVVALLLGWATTMVIASAARFNAERDRVSLLDREARVSGGVGGIHEASKRDEALGNPAVPGGQVAIVHRIIRNGGRPVLIG